MEKLKRCPFCGSDRVMVAFNPSRFNKRYYYVECTICGCRTRGEAIFEINISDENEWENVAVEKSVACWNQRAVSESA